MTTISKDLSDIIARHTSAEFDVTSNGNVYTADVFRHDVSFFEFLGILETIQETFGEQNCEFDEDNSRMFFIVNLENSDQE